MKKSKTLLIISVLLGFLFVCIGSILLLLGAFVNQNIIYASIAFLTIGFIIYAILIVYFAIYFICNRKKR